MDKSMLYWLVIFIVFSSCGKDELKLSQLEQDQLSEFMETAEGWSEGFVDIPLIPYGPFAPETKTSFSSIISTEESRQQINQFIMDLGIANDRAMHDWMLEYGTLIRDIKVANVLSADNEFYKVLSSMVISIGSDPCVIDAHAILQKHAYNKALSYSSITQSVNGPAFDLNDFMTLRGIGSALYRVHRFIDARNACR